jgi:hypothetical protein
MFPLSEITVTRIGCSAVHVSYFIENCLVFDTAFGNYPPTATTTHMKYVPLLIERDQSVKWLCNGAMTSWHGLQYSRIHFVHSSMPCLQGRDWIQRDISVYVASNSNVSCKLLRQIVPYHNTDVVCAD